MMQFYVVHSSRSFSGVILFTKPDDDRKHINPSADQLETQHKTNINIVPQGMRYDGP